MFVEHGSRQEKCVTYSEGELSWKLAKKGLGRNGSRGHRKHRGDRREGGGEGVKTVR